MMVSTCQGYRPLLSAAMDGETTYKEDLIISEHLQDCAECRETYAAYRLLRQQFQGLSQPQTPASLRVAVMARVNNRAARPLGGTRRAGRLGPLAGLGQKLSLGLAALVVLIFGSMIIAGLLRTASEPFEVQGQPVADTDEQKIIVAFSRPVDKDFVLANASDLFLVKDGAGQTLAIDFDHIKVDGERVELPFKQEAARINENENIKVVVNPAIKDQSGTRVANPGSKDAKVSAPLPAPTSTPLPTSTPVPVPSATRVPATAIVANTAKPEPTAPPPTIVPATIAPATPTVVRTTVPATVATTRPVTTTVAVTTKPAQTTSPAATTKPAQTTVTAAVTVTTTTSLPVTTSISTTPATPALTVKPVVTSTSTPVTSSATPEVTVAITPTVTAKPAVTLRSDACALDLAQSFDTIFNNRSDVALKTGCPTDEEAKASLVYQSFQRGFMLWHKQSGWIYVFYHNGNWTRFVALKSSSLPPPPLTANVGAKVTAKNTVSAAPISDCTFAPVRELGNIWLSRPAVQAGLGCALSPETTNGGGLYQPFKGGLMFFNPVALNGRRIYAAYLDGTYTDLPDIAHD